MVVALSTIRTSIKHYRASPLPEIWKPHMVDKTTKAVRGAILPMIEGRSLTSRSQYYTEVSQLNPMKELNAFLYPNYSQAIFPPLLGLGLRLPRGKIAAYTDYMIDSPSIEG